MFMHRKRCSSSIGGTPLPTAAPPHLLKGVGIIADTLKCMHSGRESIPQRMVGSMKHWSFLQAHLVSRPCSSMRLWRGVMSGMSAKFLTYALLPQHICPSPTQGSRFRWPGTYSDWFRWSE